MWDSMQEGGGRERVRRAARAFTPRVDGTAALEPRQLLAASLAPIADVSVPQHLGLPIPLEGGDGANQTYTAASTSPDIRATIIQGQFLTLNITHTSSGASDPAFTGQLVFQLFDQLTPTTVSRITQLVNEGFYNGKLFFRVAAGFPGQNDFIVQGGSSDNTASGQFTGPGFPFSDEFVQSLVFDGTGQLAMANSGRDTNSTQFFVTTGSPRFLDFKHTIFAQLVSGFDTLNQITRVALSGTQPVAPVTITTATLSPANPDGVVLIDTTLADAGETGTVTVTATAAGDPVPTTQTFRVVVNADTGNNSRALLGPVENQVVGKNQVDVFQLTSIDPDGDPVTYTVQGGLVNGAFTAVQNATATVDQSTGIVRVTPNAGFTGTINLLVGVRDQTNRAGGSSPLDTPDNFDTQAITLTVTDGPAVNLRPIALPTTVATSIGQPVTVQLSGDTANPGANQTLNFAITGQPVNGTISNLNPNTGTLTYTPGPNFNGSDTFQFNVTDVGAPTPNLTSASATVRITIAADTRAVRLFPDQRVLVVTPPAKPRGDRSRNVITVAQVNTLIQVTVNGVVDETQPASSSVDRIVVYGSKNGDRIRIANSVTQLTTLDGGHGGRNILKGGAARSRQHGWYGLNRLRGGPGNDALIGAQGRVAIRKSAGRDTAFIGEAHPSGPPTGQFYRFRNGRVVPVATPAPNHVGLSSSAVPRLQNTPYQD